jgi:hypothetical protein
MDDGHFYLLAAGEEDKDEEALQGVEHQEDVPDGLGVQAAGHQSSRPAGGRNANVKCQKIDTHFGAQFSKVLGSKNKLPKSHEDGQPKVQPEVDFRSAAHNGDLLMHLVMKGLIYLVVIFAELLVVSHTRQAEYTKRMVLRARTTEKGMTK